MAVPKTKKSRSKSRMRRGSNGTLKADFPNVIIDKTTGEYTLPHHISPDGYYNGKQIIEEKVKQTTEEEQ